MSEKSGAQAWYNGTTVGGHNIPECSSAMQKSIRRSDPEASVYFGTQLYLSGYAKYVFKRLAIIAVEDCGADLNVAVQVNALRMMWEAQMGQKSDNAAQAQLFAVAAILACATARKSRIVDNLRLLAVEGDDLAREVPDFAKDKHTPSGRKLGRDIEHFIQEGSKLCPEGHPYTEEWDADVQARAEALMMRKWGPEAKAKQEKQAPPPGEQNELPF